jgi:hypothetical protein
MLMAGKTGIRIRTTSSKVGAFLPVTEKENKVLTSSKHDTVLARFVRPRTFAFAFGFTALIAGWRKWEQGRRDNMLSRGSRSIVD